MIEKYTIDYIKFDLNYDMCTIENDPAMHLYFVGWRQFLVELKERHPGLYMECCASGGMRADLNNLMYFDSVWITDNQSPYHTMRIYKDGLRRLPPQVLERWETFISLKDFRPFYKEPYCGEKMIATDDSTWSNIVGLNSSWLEGMVFGGPFGLSCDITSFTDALKAQIKGWVNQIKADREYWKKVECRILCDTKDNFVLEYTDEDFSTVHLFAYTLHRQQAVLPVFPIVDVAATYKIDEDTYTGAQLDEKGLLLDIEDSNTCKHVVLKKV